MPRLSRLRVRVLGELAHQLRYAPPDAARKHLVRAEELAAEVLGDLAGGKSHMYPSRWVLFRLTGLSEVALESSSEDDDGSIVAEALLADLSALVERLCVAARLTADEAKKPANPTEKWISVAVLCERWGVTRKTIERHRRAGLIARRVLVGKGRAGLVFAEKTVRAFEKAQKQRAALRDAGIKDTSTSSSTKPPRRRAASKKTVERLDAGEPPSDVAHATSRSRASVQRLALCARADRLAESLPTLIVHGVDEHAASLLRSQAKILAAQPVRTGLGLPGPRDVQALLDAAAAQGVVIAAVERSLAEAYACLKCRAHAAILALPRGRPHVQDQRQPDGSVRLGLDRIETDLRWAARLKAELVRQHLPQIVRTIENVLSDSTPRDGVSPKLADLPPAMTARLLEAAVTQTLEAVEHFDASKGGRLAAPIGLVVTRVVTAWRREHGSLWSRGKPSQEGRGAQKTPPRAVAIPRPTEPDDGAARDPLDFVARACPWQAVLEPNRRVWQRLCDTYAVSIELQQLIALRMGWAERDDTSTPKLKSRGLGGEPRGAGAPPMTLDEAAAVLGVSRTKVVRLEKHAYDAVRAHKDGAPAEFS